MKVRGHRECQNCGTRWSYYETGEITCPECGAIRSVGLDEPSEHTDGTADFDLTGVRARLDEQPLREVADLAAEETRSYIRTRGFIDAGVLQELDDTYLAATELRRVGRTFSRLLQPTEREELYLLSLLRGADAGDRPETTAVPEAFFSERGLAIAASVDAYLGDVRRIADDRDSELDRALSTLRTHHKRLEALDGNVPPDESERLVRAVRDIGTYLRENDETALVRATERFEAN